MKSTAQTWECFRVGHNPAAVLMLIMVRRGGQLDREDRRLLHPDPGLTPPDRRDHQHGGHQASVTLLQKYAQSDRLRLEFYLIVRFLFVVSYDISAGGCNQQLWTVSQTWMEMSRSNSKCDAGHSVTRVTHDGAVTVMTVSNSSVMQADAAVTDHNPL